MGLQSREHQWVLGPITLNKPFYHLTKPKAWVFKNCSHLFVMTMNVKIGVTLVLTSTFVVSSHTPHTPTQTIIKGCYFSFFFLAKFAPKGCYQFQTKIKWLLPNFLSVAYEFSCLLWNFAWSFNVLCCLCLHLIVYCNLVATLYLEFNFFIFYIICI
jgi:hypothetical protein